MNNKDKKILVEIAAYRDPELLNTVNSAIIQADYPDRISFSICYQSDDLGPYHELLKIHHCRVKYLKESEAKGSCYARYLCQQMIEDEDFIFQVDSHMRFVKHWDTKMIESLLDLHDDKASISFYPPDCTEEMMTYPLDHPVFDNPCSGGYMYSKGFQDGDSYFLSNACCERGVNEDVPPQKNPFISAGNFFSFADIHRTILHDPEMYFYGDELPMAIRYFTNGWNNYCLKESYIYHKYNRKNQTFPTTISHSVSTEIVRFRQLLNLDHENYDMGEFGLGNVRTLKEYEEFAGIDFANKIVYMSAETGVFDNPILKNQLSYFSLKKVQEQFFLAKEEYVEVILIDYVGDYKKCIESCLEKAVYKNRISFIVGTVKSSKIAKSTANKYHISKILSIKEKDCYGSVLSELSQFLRKDTYCMIIDSSIRFLYGWDKFYLEAIKKCGRRAALTSWVWYDAEGVVDDNFSPYVNIVKVFDGFEYNLPKYRYDESINLSNKKYPYRSSFISDGFLFCKSIFIKTIHIDPSLRYDEHNFVYAVRLWTNGIDFYYPNTSFFYRIRKEEELLFGDYHLKVICALLRVDSLVSRELSPDYEYVLGNIRTLWEWFESFGFDYSKDSGYDV